MLILPDDNFAKTKILLDFKIRKNEADLQFLQSCHQEGLTPKFHHEVDKLKKILLKSAYSQKFIDKCIQKFLNNMFIQRLQIPSVPKKELRITLPYLGKMSQIVKLRLTKTTNKHMKFCKLRVILQTNNRFRNYFRFKDSIHETLRSNLIYKFSGGSCTVPTLVRPIDTSK